MGPEDPIAIIPSPKAAGSRGRPSTHLTKEAITQMMMAGGKPALNALVYLNSKEIMKPGKTDPNRVKLLYLQARMLGVIADIDNAGMDALLAETEKLAKRFDPAPPKTEEKPKFSEGSIDDLRVL